jgi:preprotein translocase subunit SecF
MFELIKPGTNIDFIGYRRYAMIASLAVILVGLLSLLVFGVNYGIDFAGGTLVHVKFNRPVAINDMRSALGTISAKDVTVQDFGGADSNEFIVRMLEADPELKQGLPEQISNALAARFKGKSDFEVLRVESVGPRVGKDLRERAVLAVLAATVVMGAYLAVRFEPRFGIGAAVALLHDVMVAVAALSLTRTQFDLTTVAALLTIVGFSVNDTVIVSDRIRENMRKNRREPLASVMNRSINETLSRTILTTGTAVLVVLALFFLGGEIIHGFAFTLLVGFIVGTYSSIYIASPIVLSMDFKPRTRRKAAA